MIPVPEQDWQGQAWIKGFIAGLQSLGWVEGENILIHRRWGGGDVQRMAVLAKELVEARPDVLLAGSTPVLSALKKETSTVPIVFVQVTDPLGAGLVKSLSLPGANITGLTNYEYDVVGKWLALLREISPEVSRVAMVQNKTHPTFPGYLHALKSFADQLKFQIVGAGVRGTEDIFHLVEQLASEPHGGLITVPDFTATAQRELLASVALRHRIPAVYPFRYFVEAGGLLSYGIDNVDQYRTAASFVHRILRGESAGALPVQASSKYELVVNLKTAKALDLTLPQSLLARADEVIE
jgi:putative ABC transport system substrate-binding protein